MADPPPYVIRFVDKPDAARTTLLDLNAGTDPGQIYTADDGLSLGTTEMLAVLVESMLADGEEVAASKRTNRELTIPVVIVGTVATFAGLVNSLARETDRKPAWLEFKPGEHTGESVFFEIKQGELGDVDIDPEEQGVEERPLTLSLLAAPAAVGLPQTGSATVNNDPAAATNPQILQLPTIKGDLPTPLNVTASGTALPSGGATALVGLHTGPASVRQVLQAETATLGADTTLPAVANAAMSGTGNNYARTTFATTPGMFDRVSWTSLSATFGTYRVLVRVRKTLQTDTFEVRRRLTSIGGTEFFSRTITYPATTDNGPHWLDLGIIDLPPGPYPPDITSGTVGHLGIQTRRVTGTGSLDIDVVELIPDRSGVVGQTDATIATVWHQWGSSLLKLGMNADADEVWTATASNYGHSPTRRAGPLPSVRPGYTNQLVFMRHIGTLGGGTNKDIVTADDKTWTSTIDWSYRPRWLYLSAP